ncbi:hypothetical protein [Ancylobacter sp.]|uniref:hypothetical protein n=1 Tax=Ancylobacter sp. TaxID=1872567 RepID=UPI003D0A59AD
MVTGRTTQVSEYPTCIAGIEDAEERRASELVFVGLKSVQERYDPKARRCPSQRLTKTQAMRIYKTLARHGWVRNDALDSQLGATVVSQASGVLAAADRGALTAKAQRALLTRLQQAIQLIRAPDVVLIKRRLPPYFLNRLKAGPLGNLYQCRFDGLRMLIEVTEEEVILHYIAAGPVADRLAGASPEGAARSA